MEGIRLQQPEGWDDKSMIAFNAPEMPESGVLPNIVVTQDGFGQRHERELQQPGISGLIVACR
jgi:hypothetical protein